MTSSVWPTFITFKNVFAQSLRSRIDPTNLTATNKLLFARQRIWQGVIGGNLPTGLKAFKKTLDGESRLQHFEYAFRDFYLPFAPMKDPYFFYIAEVRNLRELRKGKVKIHEPKVGKWHIPKYELKRYLHVAEKRKKQAVENLVLSPAQRKRQSQAKSKAESDARLLAEAKAKSTAPASS